jgi:transcription factor C subunit 3
MVNMQPAPSRGQKHEFEHIPEHTCVTETIERSKIAEQPQSSTSQSATNRRKQDVTGRKVDCQSRKRESPNRSVTPDSQMFDVMYDGSNSSSAGVSHKTQTTKFSHDKTSMIADYSTTECDPLPPVIGNDVLALTTYTSSHVTGNGAYPSAMSMVPTIPSHSATELDVRSQEAGPIFVLRDTFAFNDITNVVDGKAIAMATPNALTKHHSLDAAAIAPRNHQTMPPPHAKHIPFPMPVFESGKRRTAEQVVSSRITAIMVWLIDCMGGLFPAGQSLWFACRIIWRHYFNPDPCPTDERFGAQLDNLVMKKLLRVFPAEISCTDSTKAQDNTTATGFMVARDGCDIINRSHVRDIMVAVRKAHPFPYIPEVILTNLPTMTIPTEDPILTFTGRRMIIGRIESLDAPFYARDSGKVRQPSMSPYTIGASRLRLKDNLANLSSSYEPLGNATDRSSSLSRSGQKLCRVERGCLDQDTPVVLNSGNRRSCLTPALVHAADETGIRGNFPITTESGSWRTTRPPPDIQIGFLMPNMYLDKQFAPQEEMALVAKLQTTPTVSQSTDQTSIINELLPQTTSMAWKCPRLLFSPTQILRPISDKHRDHHHVPALKWFEENDQSYLVDVWAPDRTWLNLEAFPSRARRLYSTRSSSHGRNSAAFSASYENFLDNVAAIHEVEMTPSYFPPVIPTCSLPYRIFVPLNGPGQHSLGDTLCELDWDRGVHLNLESSRMLYENSGPPQDDNDNSDWAPEPMGRKRRRVTAVRDKGLNREGSLRGWRSRAPARETLKHRYMTSISQPIEAHMCTSEVTPQPRTDETLATTATANRKRCHVPLSSDHFTAHDRDDVLLTAFVVVRALLGGTNEAIDWGFMLYLFPHMSVHALRQHWVRYRKYRSVYIARLTARFQSEFIRTYEQDEIPILNFDDIHGYDWEGLIRWTMSIRVEEDVKLPASRHMLITNNPPPNEVVNTSDDPQERFFHPQSSVFSRLEAATSEPAALPLWTPHTSHSALQLVRSFVKALSGTPAKRYPISDIRTRFAPFRGYGNPGAELLDRAVNQLTAQKTICKSSKARLHGPHPFRLSELFYHTLTKLGQADKYTEASRFKQELDGAALQHAKLRLPYTVQDGATLAYINLQAHQRVALQPTSVPQIPLGFEPGKYETRKFSKRYYHFGLEIVPTTDYVMSNAIAMLGVARQEPPPLFGPNGEIPVWCDIFGILDRHRWANLIGGFLFLISTRGSLPIPGMCKAMKPLVDEFEIDLMTGWAKKVGVLRSNPLGVGLVLSEWWWLMVPSLYSDDNVS